MKTSIDVSDECKLSDLVHRAHVYLQNDFRECIMEFKNLPREDLIILHHTFGRDLRNYLGLWSMYSSNSIQTHPDELSMRIIEELHEALLNYNVS